MSVNPPGSISDLFYLTASLVPPLQQLSTIPHDMTVAEAIEYMDDMGYSQLPVKSWDQVIGVFSYRSLCRNLLEIEGELDPNETIGDMPVEDFVGHHRFFNEDDNWETILRYIKSDNSILIGNRWNLSGIVTANDVVDFLYQVAKPFVVIAEIELSLRRIISNCVNNEELQICLQNCLTEDLRGNLPASVVDMAFHDYVQVIGDGRNWAYFEPFFGGRSGSMRRRTRRTLERISELRNDAFHFRRSIEDEEIHFLHNKRNWLQRRAHIFEGEQRREMVVDEMQLQAAVEVERN